MMKKLAIGVMTACVAMGASVAQADQESKQFCEQYSQKINPNNYPQMIDKETVRRAPKAEYRSNSGQCVITVNYDIAFEKFVDQVVKYATIIENDKEEVVGMYLKSDHGEKALRQLIEEEYRPKYQALSDQGAKVFMNARFTGLQNDEEVEDQYFSLYK